MIKYLVEEGFKQMLCNSFLSRLIFIFPCVIMILMPWVADLKIKNINPNIVDNDHSVVSRCLVGKIRTSTHSRLTALPATYNEALLGIETGTADATLGVPYDLEKDWVNDKVPCLLVAANAVNGTKGSLGGSYLSSIANDYSRELMSEISVKVLTDRPFPRISVSTLNLYNPILNYKLFMILALIVVLLTLAYVFLPALSVVGEEEAGIIEQINVTPVNKLTSIAARLTPYWLIGFVVLTTRFVLAWLLYGILPAGHFLTIYVFVLVSLPVVSGFGLVTSNYSATLRQVMFVMWLFMFVSILMSGFFTSIHSMPEWIQRITRVNSLRYFVEVIRTIYFRDGGLAELFPQLGVSLIFVVAASTWATRSYRKNS